MPDVLHDLDFPDMPREFLFAGGPTPWTDDARQQAAYTKRNRDTFVGRMMPPAMDMPRRAVPQDILDAIYAAQQPKPWEQVLGRRYLDALLGRSVQARAIAVGNYPGLAEWMERLPADIREMLQVTGTRPDELIEMMRR